MRSPKHDGPDSVTVLLAILYTLLLIMVAVLSAIGLLREF